MSTNYTLSKLQPRGPRARRIAAMREISASAIGAPYDPSTANANIQRWRDFAYTDPVTGSVFPTDFNVMFGTGTKNFIQNLPNNGAITNINDWQTTTITQMTLKDGRVSNAVTQVDIITNAPPPNNPPQQPYLVQAQAVGGYPRVPKLYIKYDMVIPGNIRSVLSSSTDTSTDDYWKTEIDIKTGGYGGDSSDGDFKWSLGLQNNGGLRWVMNWINLGHDSVNREVSFTGASGQIYVGDTIVCGLNEATGIVKAAKLTSGSWGSSGVGKLVVLPTSGSFSSGKTLKVNGVTKANSSSAGVAITTNYKYDQLILANDFGLPTSGIDEWVTLEIEVTVPESQDDITTGRTWIAITDKNNVRTLLCDRVGGLACGALGLSVTRLLTPELYGRPAGLSSTWANWELWDACPYPQL